MKIFSLIAVTAIGVSGAAFAAEDHKDHAHDSKGAEHAHEAKAQHGGIVSVVKDVNYELVANAAELLLYVSDHGKPANLAGATAKLTMLSGSKKDEATLVPGKDALQAKGNFAVAAGTKVVAQVSLQGKPAQAVRFSLK